MRPMKKQMALYCLSVRWSGGHRHHPFEVCPWARPFGVICTEESPRKFPKFLRRYGITGRSWSVPNGLCCQAAWKHTKNTCWWVWTLFFFFLQAGGFGKNYKDYLFALFLYALVFIWQGWAEKWENTQHSIYTSNNTVSSDSRSVSPMLPTCCQRSFKLFRIVYFFLNYANKCS